jgi:hypothetical protein
MVPEFIVNVEAGIPTILPIVPIFVIVPIPVTVPTVPSVF